MYIGCEDREQRTSVRNQQTLAPVVLWRIADAPTALLMGNFYQQLAAGIEPSGALRGAQHWLQTLTRQDVINLLRTGQHRGWLSGGTVDEFESKLSAADEHPFEHPLFGPRFSVSANTAVR